MKIQIKFIVGLWVLVAQFCTTLVRGDLFNFPKESLLNAQQQEEVRNVFMETMLDASRSFVVYLQNPLFKRDVAVSSKTEGSVAEANNPQIELTFDK